MCDFVSWIEGKVKGKKVIWFLTDADCKKLMRKEPKLDWDDVIGHAAIRDAKPEAWGRDNEGVYKIPPVIAKAIKAGKMNNMMEKGGMYKELHYDEQGRLHSLSKAALVSGRYNTFYIHGRAYSDENSWKIAKEILRKAAKAKK